MEIFILHFKLTRNLRNVKNVSEMSDFNVSYNIKQINFIAYDALLLHHISLL